MLTDNQTLNSLEHFIEDSRGLKFPLACLKGYQRLKMVLDILTGTPTCPNSFKFSLFFKRFKFTGAFYNKNKYINKTAELM